MELISFWADFFGGHQHRNIKINLAARPVVWAPAQPQHLDKSHEETVLLELVLDAVIKIQPLSMWREAVL